MADDPFEEVLDLEDGFYKEGYDAGVADSAYSGMVEGKTFGLEKGYEKAMELGRLHGRALVWQKRSSAKEDTEMSNGMMLSFPGPQDRSTSIKVYLPALPKNVRLAKHIQSLLELTCDTSVVVDNSDEAVTDFDDRISKAQAKSKVIANIAGEHLNPSFSSTSIEDATGVQARQ